MNGPGARKAEALAQPQHGLVWGVWCQAVSAEMAFGLTTAIVSDLAGRVLASSLGGVATCAGGTADLLARSRRPTIPVAARVPASDPVRSLGTNKLLGKSRSSTIRGELAIGRGSSRHNLVFGRSTRARP